MADLISRAAAIAQIKENYCDWCDHTDLCQSCETRDCIATIEQQLPAVDAVPIKPLSVWLAGYAVPPKYTVETNPVDSAKARAEGWEKHIRNLIECGLMEEE